MGATHAKGQSEEARLQRGPKGMFLCFQALSKGTGHLQVGSFIADQPAVLIVGKGKKLEEDGKKEKRPLRRSPLAKAGHFRAFAAG